MTNAINRWNAENGTIGVPSAFWQSSTSDNELVLELAKQLNSVKTCSSSKVKECGGRYEILQYKKINDGQGNTYQESWFTGQPRIILADGAFVFLQSDKSDTVSCERNVWIYERDENGMYIEDTSSPTGFKGHYSINKVCGRLAFDTNGLKGPNQIGVDVFEIAYYGDGTIGASNDSWGNINYVLVNDRLIKTEKYTVGKF